MSFPVDLLRSDPYPLHCTRSFYDGFSGWFAVSDPSQCLDFCFWEIVNSPAFSLKAAGDGVVVVPHHDTSNQAETAERRYDDSIDAADPLNATRAPGVAAEQHYDSTNTADPHNATRIPGVAEWRCALNVGGDDVRWEAVADDPDAWLSAPGAFGPTFPYLRCNRGTREVLNNAGREVANSVAFWSVALVVCLLGLPGLFFCVRWCRRRPPGAGLKCGSKGETDGGSVCIYQEASAVEKDGDRDEEFSSPGGGVDEEEGTGTMKSSSVSSSVGPAVAGGASIGGTESADDDALVRSGSNDDVENNKSFGGGDEGPPSDDVPPGKCAVARVRCRRCCAVASVISAVALLLAGIVLSIMSLIEISGVHYSDPASKLTPKCVDPNSVCPAGNENINRPSRRYDGSGEAPFSYVVASDAQLNWWAGESPLLGVANIPKPCQEGRDSCGSCMAKVGHYTNGLLRNAVQRQVTAVDESDAENSTVVGGVVPSTLIMNGDLSSYFHPHERSTYEHYIHSIPGVKSYFPSLGNHDYDHFSGARYGTDQWIGPSNCNARHALGYMKGAFCGSVPGFDPSRIVRYDAASLAYSWEEGRYHFVHLHYYPAFESATIYLRSSVSWLDQDLMLAYEANLTSVIFVHAQQGMNPALENAVLGRNVKAIFAGHSHRCLMRKCFFLRNLLIEEVFPGWNATVEPPTPEEIAAASPPPGSDKCVTGKYALCGGAVSGSDGMNLWYLANRSNDDLVLPETTLRYAENIGPGREQCSPPKPIFVNVTDNTLLCTKAMSGDPEFPPLANNADEGEHIPVFWSGSASFETFLKVDFHPDRIVVNAMTTSEEAAGGGGRFLDAYDVPSAVYPYHDRSDVEEMVIEI